MWVRSLAIRLNVGEISRHEITCGIMWGKYLGMKSYMGEISQYEIICG